MANNNCFDCPFHSRTCSTRGPKAAPVVIVGESPGATEVRVGRPFVGQSGELLSELLKRVGLDEKQIYITNAIKCLPPRSKDAAGNRVKDGVMNEACKACRSNLMAELSAHPRKLIITMGSAASRTLADKWNYSIMKSRGQVFPFEGSELGVLPTYHPAYILRNPSATPQLRTDLNRAKQMLSGTAPTTPDVRYEVVSNRFHLTSLLAATARKYHTIVADIETTGLNRYQDDLLSFGFMFAEQASFTEPNTVYILDDMDLISEMLSFVKTLREKLKLPRIKWAWHNGKFDTSFMRTFSGVTTDFIRVDEDTMLLSYTLDEAGGKHSLENCVIDHLGFPAYKSMLEEWAGKGQKKNFSSVPKATLYDYQSRDVAYTALVLKTLLPKVQAKTHLRKAYYDLMIPASNALATVELNGMPINQRVLESSELEITKQIEPIITQLRTLAGDVTFNPNSHVQVKHILESRFKIKVVSTSEDKLKGVKDHPFVATLLKYRELQKQRATYLTSFRQYGARVHTSYLIHGTVTGRLSSSSPNMQNIPKEDVVRRHFQTTKGRIFVSFDYSQAELKSLAVLSGDKNLLEIFRQGKDMHSTVAAEIYGELFTREHEYLADGKTENPVYGKMRRNAKMVNFGIVYGATKYRLMETLGISMQEAEKLVNGWFSMFPDARKYMDLCRQSPILGRPLITVFGRQRRFYVVAPQNKHGQENEAGNFPHQSMCSDFTLSAAIEIDRLYQQNKLPGNAMQCNIIHDDNLFEIDDNLTDIVNLVKMVKPIMEGVPVKQGITELTFTTDAKMGTIWSRMQKIPMPKEAEATEASKKPLTGGRSSNVSRTQRQGSMTP